MVETPDTVLFCSLVRGAAIFQRSSPYILSDKWMLLQKLVNVCSHWRLFKSTTVKEKHHIRNLKHLTYLRFLILIDVR